VLVSHRETLAAAAGAGSLIGAVILYSAAPTPENGQLRLAGVYMIGECCSSCTCETQY
jgi:hypothetical protein